MQSAPLTDLLHQSLGRDVLAAATPPSLARLPMAIGVETSLIKSSPRRMHPLLTTNVSRSATKNLWRVNVRLRYCQGVGERPLAPLRRPPPSSITSPADAPERYPPWRS